MIPFCIGEKVSEMPASKHIYIQKNVLGGSCRLPIGNEESRRVRKRTPKKNTQSTGMSRKSKRENKVAIASYRPIRKAEAADCIISDEERERGNNDDDDDTVPVMS